MAATPVMHTLDEKGATPTLRSADAKDGPLVTDQGLWIVDAHFPDGIPEPVALDRTLCEHPGVLDHGLFLDRTDDLLVGRPNGSVDHHSAV